MKIKFLWPVAVIGLALRLDAAPLTESTFTEVIKDVNVVANDTKSATSAKINDSFKAPDLVRTGPDSRAELTAPDQTITRVGANSVFSFEPARRNLRLEQGNVLFHPPAGAGGGTITSGGTTAAVLGTTLIVSATPDGGFKVILLEGTGTVTLPGGTSATLNAGQLVFVLPGGTLSPVLDINLGKLVGGSLLVNGFPDQLSSLPLIEAAIAAQNAKFKSGKAVDTGLPPDAFLNPPAPGNGLDAVDHGTYQAGTPPPVPPLQFSPGSGVTKGGGTTGGGQTGAPGGRGIIPITSTPPAG